MIDIKKINKHIFIKYSRYRLYNQIEDCISNIIYIDKIRNSHILKGGFGVSDFGISRFFDVRKKHYKDISGSSRYRNIEGFNFYMRELMILNRFSGDNHFKEEYFKFFFDLNNLSILLDIKSDKDYFEFLKLAKNDKDLLNRLSKNRNIIKYYIKQKKEK